MTTTEKRVKELTSDQLFKDRVVGNLQAKKLAVWN